MKPIRCTRAHAEAIRAIFNDAIVHTTALYDYRPRTPEMLAAWFEAKEKGKYPVIGLESDAGEFIGFATYGRWRERPAYKYSVEHSVYVDRRFRGQGFGRELLKRIVAEAEGQGYHLMIGGIDASNAVSIRLHESLGFTHCGTVREAGYKFGRWLDVAFYQLLLATPTNPVDG